MSTSPITAHRPSGEEALPNAEVEPRARIVLFLRQHARSILPLIILAIGAVIWQVLAQTAPQPETQPRVVVAPLVRVATVQPQSLRLNVVAHGTVLPRTESDLVAEVRGRILEVAPALVAGGFFESGDLLLRLDDRENRIAVDRAQAQVQLRKSEAELAWAEARRRRELADRGAASAADLEQFESRGLVGQAALEEARASLEQAQLDLERTIVRAPFDGRVRERTVDLGQFVNPGTKLARIYAVDYAEARLPVPTEDLVHLDLALGFEPSADPIDGAPITLRARLGGRDLEWPATLVRSEGEIDLRTRTLHLVARVDDPYGRHSARVSPLPSGLFVEAEIEGRELSDVFVLPAAALRDGDAVYVVDASDRLAVREVDVVRRDREQVVIRSGLKAGERIVVSPLRAVSDGMLLRVAEADRS